MKIRNILASLICAFALAAGVQAADAPKTPLGEQMEKISNSYSAVGKAITAKDAAAGLKAATAIREAGEAALKLEPAKKADVPAAEQAKFIADYQAEMKAFIADAAKLEAAFKAGNFEEADTVRKALKQHQNDDHPKFKAKAKK